MEAPAFTLSHFLRHSGEVLDATTRDDVVLRRRDGDDVVLTTAGRARAFREGLDLLAATVREANEHDAAGLAAAIARAAPWTALLSRDERVRMLRDVADAAATAAALGSTEPLARALGRWQLAARTTATQPRASAHTTRPVFIPDDVDDPSIEKASGIVDLRLGVRWSYPRRTYDLGDVRQLRRVYEQVLREGIEDDVRRFIEVDKLIENWDELVLPPRVRRAWSEWVRSRRNVVLAC